jgi:transcriptional regulator with XRE-family HTH domain
MEKSIYSPEYAAALRVLRQAREHAGLTQVELAERLGQTQSFVTKVERGDRRLDIVQLRSICQVLGLTMTDFVRRWEQDLEAAE